MLQEDTILVTEAVETVDYTSLVPGTLGCPTDVDGYIDRTVYCEEHAYTVVVSVTTGMIWYLSRLNNQHFSFVLSLSCLLTKLLRAFWGGIFVVIRAQATLFLVDIF